MSQNSFDNYKFPISEVDVPPTNTEGDIPIVSMSKKEADIVEKRFKMLETHEFKQHGLRVIIGCLIGYFLIVVLDSILFNVFEWQTSTLVTSFVELLKFLVSTLIGFVFSETIKSENR